MSAGTSKRRDHPSKRNIRKRVLSYCLLFRLVVLVSASYNANKFAPSQKSTGSKVSQSTKSALASSGALNDIQIRSNEGDQPATIVDNKTFSKVKEKQQMNNNTKPNASFNLVGESEVNYFKNDRIERPKTILCEADKKKRIQDIADYRNRFHDLVMSDIFKAKSRNNFRKINRLMSSKKKDDKKNIDPWLFEENPIFTYFFQEADKDENSAIDTILYVGCVLILFAILTVNLIYLYLQIIKPSNSTFLLRNTLNQSRLSKIFPMALGLLLSRAPVGSDVTVSTTLQGTYFLNDAPGRYLEGHVHESFVVSTLFECQMKCDTLHSICMSLNYIENEGPNICEINNETQYCPRPGEFIIKENSFYIETMPENNNVVTRCRSAAQSCLDYLKMGYKYNDFYEIHLHDIQGISTLTVYCDMNSEAGAAWTLVESYSLENIKMPEFQRALPTNASVNENSPNWNQYRMTLAMMTHVKSQSTHWRATCSFSTHHGVDYTDYVRAKFTDFDVMNFSGNGVCKKVEYVNIRGHHCANCTSKWWQNLANVAAHIDSSQSGCQFDPTPGAIIFGGGEDNFGFYFAINNKFRCTSGPSSTTNWWFGGYR